MVPGFVDAVIHDVAIGYCEPRRIETKDGLPHVLAVEVTAPYGLAEPNVRPKRLVYLRSGMPHGGRPEFNGRAWTRRP